MDRRRAALWLPVLNFLIGGCSGSSTPAVSCPDANPPAPLIGPTMPCQMPEQGRSETISVAVMPLDEPKLFRAERIAVRQNIAARLAKEKDLNVIPLADVDEALRPVTAKKEYCAFEQGSRAWRARRKGWATTDLYDYYLETTKSMQLQLDVVPRAGGTISFAGPWDGKLDLARRYEQSISTLKRQQGEHVDLLGALLGSFDNIVGTGPVQICEVQGFAACAPETRDWLDRESELAACFAGADKIETRLLIDPTSRSCEIDDLDDPGGKLGQQEACLCKAVAASSRMGKLASRTQLKVKYESADLADKPRPSLRSLEISANLSAALKWFSGGPAGEGSRKRLYVENLDAMADSLARCKAPQTIIVVALSISEAGYVKDAVWESSLKDKKLTKCVEEAAKKAAFDCTDDGKPGLVRVAIQWL